MMISMIERFFVKFQGVLVSHLAGDKRKYIVILDEAWVYRDDYKKKEGGGSAFTFENKKNKMYKPESFNAKKV